MSQFMDNLKEIDKLAKWGIDLKDSKHLKSESFPTFWNLYKPFKSEIHKAGIFPSKNGATWILNKNIQTFNNFKEDDLNLLVQKPVQKFKSNYKHEEDELKFSNYGDIPTLCCPNCKENCLHQNEVRAIFRPEDTDGLMVTSNKKGVTTRAISSKEVEEMNGGRRDVMYIDFICEQCSYHCDEITHKILNEVKIKFTLRIKQHKGNTFVEWV